jgi:hypothetical protein
MSPGNQIQAAVVGRPPEARRTFLVTRRGGRARGGGVRTPGRPRIARDHRRQISARLPLRADPQGNQLLRVAWEGVAA